MLFTDESDTSRPNTINLKVWREPEMLILTVSEWFNSVFSTYYIIHDITLLFYVNWWTFYSLFVKIFSDIPPNQTVPHIAPPISSSLHHCCHTHTRFCQLAMLSVSPSFLHLTLSRHNINRRQLILWHIIWHLLLSHWLFSLSPLISLSPWQWVALLSSVSLQMLILSYFLLFLCIILVLWWSHCVFSSSLSCCRLWCEKSDLNNNIFKSISQTKESISTQCYYELCGCFMLYLRVVCALYVKFMNFIFFTPSKIIYITW